jgi:hypothetical protein
MSTILNLKNLVNESVRAYGLFRMCLDISDKSNLEIYRAIDRDRFDNATKYVTKLTIAYIHEGMEPEIVHIFDQENPTLSDLETYLKEKLTDDLMKEVGVEVSVVGNIDQTRIGKNTVEGLLNYPHFMTENERERQFLTSY